MSSYIRQIQTKLKEAGYYKGAIDGVAGRLTVEAVNLATQVKAVTIDEITAVAEQFKSNPIDNEPTLTSSQPVKESGFVLSERSLNNLKGVHADLVHVVKRAIEISNTDFAVIEGVRTKARQAELVKKGASKTMNSRHLTGHAVDIVPIVNGKISWNFNDYYPLAEAMATAADELGVRVRWGGSWSVINNKNSHPSEWVKAYRAKGGRFLDGVHFELPA